MKNSFKHIVLSIALILSASNAFAQTTEFTYQGSLKNGANPASGNYDFEFALFDGVSGGTQLGSTVSANNITVVNGTFSVKLNFGNQFSGANRFLEIRVRQTGGGAFTPLLPRQAMSSLPYSVKSLTADNATNAVNATNATNSTNATNATNATTATNALQLGGVTANQYLTITNANTSYIQNIPGIGQQNGSFNISGNGNANIFNAATQYNLGGNRFLSFAGGNILLGLNTGFSNTTGEGNSFFGNNAGVSNTTGFANSFVGHQAGESNMVGNRNSFVGLLAGQANTTGSQNSFFGMGAGGSNTMGSNNTTIGFSANVGAGNLTNATAIGAQTLVTQSNSLVLGNNVNVGIGLTAPTFKLQIIDSSNTGLRVQTNAAGGTVASFGGNGAFQIDAPFIPGGRFQVAESGEVSFSTLGAAGSTSLCRNALNQISTCTPGNLTENSENATMLNALREQLKQQQREIDELKQIVCIIKPDAAVCK